MDKGIRSILYNLNESRNKDRERLEDFLEEVYGKDLRKGLDKLSLSHPFDVVDNARIEEIDDIKRSLKVMRGGFLHDVLEDYDISESELQNRLNIKEDELDLLRRMSRNNKNNDEYWDGIFEDRDTLRVKLADRISNLKDLKNWIRSRKGFTKDSLSIYKKYKKESRIINRKFEEDFNKKEYVGDREVSSLWQMKVEMNNILDEIKRKKSKYGSNLKERKINEKLFDVETFEIDEEDLYDTVEIVRDMYDKYEEL